MNRRQLLAGLGVSLASPALAQAPLPMRIGFQTGEINVLLMHAVESGLFQRAGLNVALTPFPAGPAMLPALAGAQVDIAWMGEFPSVTGYSSALPIEILFMERIDFTNVRLSVNPAAGITSLSTMRGKRFGIAIGSTSHYHFLRALTQGGLTASDVTIVNLTPANMPPAYTAGQIDGAFVWEPNIGAIERQGAKPIATTRSLGMITGGVWVARRAFTGQQGETVQRFLGAWNTAQAEMRADPRRVRAAEARRVNMSADEFDALVAGQSVQHPSFRETLTADFLGAPGQELDSRLMKHLQGIGTFLVAEQRIPALPADWKGLFNTKPIQQYLAAHPG